MAETNNKQGAAHNNKEKENTSGLYTHKFREPFKYDGKEYVTLDFNFNQLTGADMVQVEQEMSDNSEYAMAAEISKSLQCKLAARAANIGSDVIMAMPIADFNKITNETRRFLLDSGY